MGFWFSLSLLADRMLVKFLLEASVQLQTCSCESSDCDGLSDESGATEGINRASLIDPSKWTPSGGEKKQHKYKIKQSSQIYKSI